MDIVTEHPVYSFWVDGDICRVVEKEEDQFYLETLDLKIPTTFEVQAPESMKVSESDKLICTTEGSCKMDYTYESSDPNIVSVDETGGLNAWKAGTATITITAETIGVTKQVTITVDGSQYEDAEVFSKVNLEEQHPTTFICRIILLIMEVPRSLIWHRQQTADISVQNISMIRSWLRLTTAN